MPTILWDIVCVCAWPVEDSKRTINTNDLRGISLLIAYSFFVITKTVVAREGLVIPFYKN